MPKTQYQPVILTHTSRLTFEERLEYQKLGIMADELPTIYLNNRMEKTEYSSVLGLFLEKAARRPKEVLDEAVECRRKEQPGRPLIEPELPIFGRPLRPVADLNEEFSLTAAYGYTLKRVIAKHLSIRFGAPVYPVPMLLQHPHFPYLLAKPDFVAVFPDPETGELSQKVLLKCRTASHWKEDALRQEIPVEHELSARQELAVTNLDECIVAYLCDNNESSLLLYRVSRDYALESKLIQCAKNFWVGNVEQGVIPVPAAPSNAAERDIALYAASRRRYHRPPELLERGLAELVQQYADQKEVYNQKKKEYEEADEELKQLAFRLSPYMLGKEEAVCGDVKMRWIQRKSRSFDAEGLALAYPDIYNRFVQEKNTPAFEVRVKKSAQGKKEAA